MTDVTEILDAEAETAAGTIELMILTMSREELDEKVVATLREVVASGHARLLDLAVVIKHADETVEIYDEVDELANVGLDDISPPDSQVLLSEDDLAFVAGELEPAHSALVAVCEESWVSRVGRVAGESGGTLGLHAHVSREASPSSRDSAASPSE